MYDIIFIGADTPDFRKLKERFPLAKRANTFIEANQKVFTKMFWVVYPDIKVRDDFLFDYNVPEWDEKYIHVFKNGRSYDGIALFPKNAKVSKKELQHRFYLTMKEVEIDASEPKLYDIFDIDTYEEYLDALENSTTDMFWMTSRNFKPHKDFEFDMYFEHSNVEDRQQNHSFIHRVGTIETYNGIILCSKHKPLSKKEVEYRFPLQRREWEIIASVPLNYSRAVPSIDTYEDYKELMDNAYTTEMIWLVPADVMPDPEFKFNTYFTHDNEFDRTINHVFLNGEHYDGIMLLSKHSPISEREFKNRFIINKKEWEIVASTPKKFDIFYIDTFEEYEQALKNTTTELFWMTSKNLQPAPDFDFSLYISHHNRVDREQNHAFIHRVDGKDNYNGIFLLSKNKPLTKREVEYRFPVERKEWDIVASGPVVYERYVFN